MGDQLLPKVTAASGVSDEIKQGRHNFTQFHFAITIHEPVQCSNCRNIYYIIEPPLTFCYATAEL